MGVGSKVVVEGASIASAAGGEGDLHGAAVAARHRLRLRGAEGVGGGDLRRLQLGCCCLLQLLSLEGSLLQDSGEWGERLIGGLEVERRNLPACLARLL